MTDTDKERRLVTDEEAAWWRDHAPTSGFLGDIVPALLDTREALTQHATLALEQLEWADDVIHGPHDTCEMCEVIVPLRSLLSHLRG